MPEARDQKPTPPQKVPHRRNFLRKAAFPSSVSHAMLSASINKMPSRHGGGCGDGAPVRRWLFGTFRPSRHWKTLMSERDPTRPEDIKDTQVQPDLATPVRDDTPAPASATVGAMEPELQAFIGRQLRQTYDEVLNEPVPDRFLELLKQLEASKADQA